MDFTKIYEAMASQAPGLVVLVFLVRAFLKHEEGRDALLRILHEEHLAAREESRQALIENTKSNRDVSVAIGDLKEVIYGCTDRGKRA